MASAVQVEKPDSVVCCLYVRQSKLYLGYRKVGSRTPVEFCLRRTEPVKPADMLLPLRRGY